MNHFVRIIRELVRIFARHRSELFGEFKGIEDANFLNNLCLKSILYG